MLDTDKKKIAIIPSGRLGDGLVICILADNLARNNCYVTLYSNILFQIASWIPEVNFCKHPEPSDLMEQLSCYDVVYISDWVSRRMPENLLQSLGEKVTIFVDMLNTKTHKDYIQKISTRQIDPGCHFDVQSFHAHSGISLTHHDLDKTAVENVVDFCSHRLNLINVSKDVRLNIPNLLKKKSNYIIIHPESSIYKKNWAPQKYLKLASQLVNQGYDVVFSVAPDEFSKWDAIIRNRFRLTQWSLDELARELYQARLFIGSDSGPGHLASLLGTPTVTIFIRKRTYYTWRPGWGQGYIVHPALPLSILKTKDHQRSPLSVGKVLGVCQLAMQQTELVNYIQ